MNNFYKRAWSEVNLDVLKQNIAVIRGICPQKEIIAIVKANAYGHGDVQCAGALIACGVRHFAVSNLWEAQQLSENGIDGDILIFGYCDIPLILENLGKNYIFTVGDTDYAKELSECALANKVKIPVHIKIDTGMSRVGITTEEQLDFILALGGLDVRAGYTHFAVSDSLDNADVDFTEKQQARLIGMCKKRGLATHSQNSGGIIYHAAILSERMNIENNIKSDCAPLCKMVQNMMSAGVQIHAMRDITRGGLGTVLCEFAKNAGCGFEIDEDKIPITPEVRGFCKILGLNVMHMGNEGKLLAVVAESDAQKAIEIIRKSRYGENAAIVGRAVKGGDVTLITPLGGRRKVTELYGEGLPRIC